MMLLRPYQTDAITELRNGFKSHRRQVLCLPTGAGKTVVFSEMVRLAAERGTITLVLTDRIELFEQTFKSLSRAGVSCQRLEAATQSNFNENAIVTVGMIETVKRRLSKGVMDGYIPQLIIIDEAHKANFNSLLDSWYDSRVIGATATPVGKHFYKYYTNIIQNIDIPDLVTQGFLMQCRAFQMQDDMSDLETRAGEYTDASLMNHYNKQKLFDGVIDEWRKRANGKKTLVFNVNIDHAVNMTNQFNKAGIVSEVVTSKTPKDERKRILQAFKDGYIPVLNNCGILTTGYDEPSIECVIMNRATKSLPLFLQCAGRGSRPCPEIGKEEFIFLDFGMNHDQHGLWSEERTWKIEPAKKKKKQDVAPVKECPNCAAMLHASVMRCQYCSHEFERKKSGLLEGSMVEVTPTTPSHLIGRKVSSLNLLELAECQRSKKLKASYCWRVVRSFGKDALKDYAKIFGYSNGWIYKQSLDIDNSNYFDYTLK